MENTEEKVTQLAFNLEMARRDFNLAMINAKRCMEDALRIIAEIKEANNGKLPLQDKHV